MAQTVGPVVNYYAGGGASSFWRTWLPVFVAMLSAGIAGFSAWLAWRNQLLGFAKDVAAVRRDVRGKQGTVALLAFENSIARPVGQALDLLDQLSQDLGRLTPQDPAGAAVALEQFGRKSYAELARGSRLCREADDARAPDRARSFVATLVNASLEAKLIAAARELLGGQSGSAYDDAADAVVPLKVALRQALENERAAEAARWQDLLADDPFVTVAERLLPRWLRDAHKGRPKR